MTDDRKPLSETHSTLHAYAHRLSFQGEEYYAAKEVHIQFSCIDRAEYERVVAELDAVLKKKSFNDLVKFSEGYNECLRLKLASHVSNEEHEKAIVEARKAGYDEAMAKVKEAINKVDPCFGCEHGEDDECEYCTYEDGIMSGACLFIREELGLDEEK